MSNPKINLSLFGGMAPREIGTLIVKLLTGRKKNICFSSLISEKFQYLPPKTNPSLNIVEQYWPFLCFYWKLSSMKCLF